MSHSQSRFVGIAVVITVLLTMSAGIAVAASETATITSASPNECSTLGSGSEVTFTVDVSYDLDGQTPDRVTVDVSEDGYAGVDKEVDLSGYGSSDTVEVQVTEQIDSSWEKVTLDVTVWPEGQSSTSANDRIRYDVTGSTYDCETEPESVSGGVSVPDSDEAPPTLIVLERLADGETDYQEVGSEDLFEFTDNEFVEPGDYRIHYYGNDDGYPPYWGYVDVDVTDGEDAYVNVERGGVYHSSLAVLDGSGDTRDLRFAPGGSGEAEFTFQRPANGESASVAVYIHPEGTQRGDSPSSVHDVGRISGSTEDATVGFDLPTEEGSYEVDFVVETYFPALGGSYVTDIVEGPTVIVDAYEAPLITDSTPSDGSVQLAPNETERFEVTVFDPDTGASDLTYVWSVDGDRAGTGSGFTFDASKYGGGAHTVELVVDDETDRTDPATLAWAVDIVEAPVVDAVDPGSTEITAGETVRFTATASDPGGHTPLSYEWTIGGGRFDGPEASYTFSEVGRQTVSLAVKNAQGVETTSEYTVAVENDEPELERVDPTGEAVETRAGSTERFVVTVSDQDASPVTVTLSVDGQPVESKTIDQANRKATFEQAFDDPGERTVEITVEDAHGSQATISYSVAVQSRPPEFVDWSPQESTLTSVESGESVQFEVTATDPDGESVSYEWYVDGSYAGSGETFTQQFTTSGEYTVTVVAKDASGATERHEWSVLSSSFGQQPGVDTQISANAIEPGGTREFVTVSFQNPSANERTARVELLVQPPDGVTVSGASNVDESDAAQFVSYAVSEPGSQTSISLKIAVQDDSLAGERLDIPFEVRYHPQGNSDDVTVVENGTIELSVVGETGTAASGESDQPGATETESPGFGIVPALAAGAVALLVAGRRTREG